MYMIDGVYQSAIAFFFVYLNFAPATFSTESGLDLAELKRMGIFVATIAVCAANIYVLFNTYRWDWIISLVVVISTLFIWFWTGIYTTFTGSAQFYKGGAEVYSSITFWATLLVAIIACLLPRFTAKSVQKMFFPIDVDIIREQVKLGKFDYLKETDAYIPPPPTKALSKVPSDASRYKVANAQPGDEDVRPIYPPSVAPTATTHNPRSQNGSGSTEFTYRPSLDAIPQALNQAPNQAPNPALHRLSMDRARPSFDRARMSMDRVRPSFECSNDFTSAAMLTRMESAHSRNSYSGPSQQQQQTGQQQTGQGLSRLRNVFRRPTVTREEAPEHLRDPEQPPVPAISQTQHQAPGSPPRSPR
jgi:phospholipid-translocating ATPase